jgi:hypothetical protein
MINRNSSQSTDRDNPFLEMLGRMSGLAQHWAHIVPIQGSNGNALGDLNSAFDRARSAFADATGRQLDIISTTQRRMISELSAIAQARSPQELWARQIDVVSAIADAGLECSLVWAECCNQLREDFSGSVDIKNDDAQQRPSQVRKSPTVHVWRLRRSARLHGWSFKVG